MHIDTEQFGRIEINEDDVITFPEGIPGFEELQRFALLSMGEEFVNFSGCRALTGRRFVLLKLIPLSYIIYEVKIEDDDFEL